MTSFIAQSLADFDERHHPAGVEVSVTAAGELRAGIGVDVSVGIATCRQGLPPRRADSDGQCLTRYDLRAMIWNLLFQ
jgi:hypothetical protein